jgi:hypothetical protein
MPMPDDLAAFELFVQWVRPSLFPLLNDPDNARLYI